MIIIPIVFTIVVTALLTNGKPPAVKSSRTPDYKVINMDKK